MQDNRPAGTAVHYTMKTPSKHSPLPGSSHSHRHQPHTHSRSHSHTQPQSSKAGRASKTSTTPLASPRTPFSVGQNHPPKLSPGRPQDVRSSSPSYFGLAIDPGNDTRESSGIAKGQWTPSTSSVTSFGAAIPKQVPIDANPDFEAFRKQADINRGKSFAVSSSHGAPAPSDNGAPTRPRPPRWHTHGSDAGSSTPFGRHSNLGTGIRPASRMDIDQDSMQDSAYVSAESKRNSDSSLFPLNLPSVPRFESPAPMDKAQSRNTLTRAEDRDPRLSMMEHKVDPPSPRKGSFSRAATLPADLDASQPHMISGAEMKEMVSQGSRQKMLLIDIRSAQNYAHSRIQGALNLCIPTTLLKRATFNLHKLQQTFQTGPASDQFSKWREADSIVVYDSHSSDTKDAVTAQNMIKKFTNEGYSGRTYILRGGFSVFYNQYPQCVDERSTAEMAEKSAAAAHTVGLAPVIGGVTLPTTQNPANPFFSNIRQNMDLADGVGQLPISRPANLDSPTLPPWLRQAASRSDQGKTVAQKFYNIEKEEQSRMKGAYAAFDPNNPQGKDQVLLSGVEQGGKNRYKDILPFEHARVRLHEKGDGTCDYINASHIKASGSNKRYIASQGPLPATFEDFWSLIWEQDVRVIVMLTAESEGGQLKCHPYWKGKDHGAIRLKHLSEKKASLDIDKHRADSHVTPNASAMGELGRRRANTTSGLESTATTPQVAKPQGDAPYVIIRKFALSHAAHPFAPIREITHLHFPAWPDFGAPAQPSHLLALVELANVMQRAAMPMATTPLVDSRKSSTTSIDALPHTWHDEPEGDPRTRPMLVHCSAGCGRTGTFCTVDTVVDMLKRQRQAKLADMLLRNEQEDTPMRDIDDAVSPTTSSVPFFQPTSAHRRQASIDKRASLEAAAIDTSWLDDETLDLISRTVEDFRGQRLSMVQSLRQFVLCYETILEWVNRMDERGRNSISGRGRGGSLRRSR